MTHPRLLQSPVQHVTRELLRILLLMLSLEECAHAVLATLGSEAAVAPVANLLDLNDSNDAVEGLANQMAALLVLWNQKLNMCPFLLKHLRIDGVHKQMFDMMAVPMAQQMIRTGSNPTMAGAKGAFPWL